MGRTVLMAQQTREGKVSAASEQANGSQLIKIALADDHAILTFVILMIMRNKPGTTMVMSRPTSFTTSGISTWQRRSRDLAMFMNS